MAKITSNEYVKVAWVLDANMTTEQAKSPTEAILNAATTLQLSPALAWENFSLAATDSDDIDDRGIIDPGNAVSRGFSNFEAALSFFRDANQDDVLSDYVKAFEAFRTPRTYGYLVIRVAEKKWNEPWAAGDRISVFRFVADTITDDVEGDDSVKFAVNFLPQGVLHVYTRVAGAANTITGVPATAAMAVGDAKALAPVIAGTSARVTVTYTSSAPGIASVTAGGLVVARSEGTANITVSHPAVTAPIVQAVTVA